jgi:hypothetical protein
LGPGFRRGERKKGLTIAASPSDKVARFNAAPTGDKAMSEDVEREAMEYDVVIVGAGHRRFRRYIVDRRQ